MTEPVSTRIRVGHVHHTMERPGGGQALILRLIRGSDPQRFEHRVYLIGTPAQEEYNLSGIPVARSPMPARSRSDSMRKRLGDRLRLVRAQWAVLSAIRKDRVDIVHIHGQVYRDFLPLQCLARLAGLRVIRTSHASSGKDRIQRQWSGRCAALTCHIWIAVGGDVAEQVHAVTGLRNDKIQVIPNGIDEEVFRPDRHDTREAIRRQLDICADEPVVLWVGRLIELKNPLLAVRAFACARAELGRGRLLIAGNGPERAILEREIRTLNLRDTVTLLGARTDVADLYAAADLYVITSIKEGMPTTVAEAMLSGVPVLGTDASGIRYACDYGRAGVLVPAQSPEKMAEAMVALAANPCRRAELARAGLEWSRSLFTLDAMVRAYEAVYERMAGPEGVKSGRGRGRVLHTGFLRRLSLKRPAITKRTTNDGST